MITEGIFTAKVKSHAWTRSGSGTTGLRVVVEITDGLSAGDEMTGMVWFSEKSMRMGRAQLKALGFDVDGQPLKAIGTTVSLVGHECRIQVKSEEYKGETQLKIGFFMPKDETPPEAELDGLEKQLRAAKSATSPAKAKPKTSPAPGVATSPAPPLTKDGTEDDGIPF